MLAVLAAALAVPLGFALSLESTARTVIVAPPAASQGDISIVAASAARSQLALVQTSTRADSAFPTLPDGAKLLFVGSALFGLAGVMRRTN